MSRLATYQFSSGADQLAVHGLILLDPEGNILLMNSAAEEISGYLSSELRECPFWTLVEELPGNTADYEQETLHILHSKDRGDVPVLIRFSPLIEEQEYQLVLLRDLEAATDTELRLKAQQTKLNALLDAIPDSIFIQDFTGKFLDYYPPLTRPLFESSTEIQGKHMDALFPADLTQRFMEAFKGIRMDRQPRNLEFSLGKAPTAHYEARLVPMNNHKILSIVREVTESKMVENILNLRNRALEAAGNGFVISDARLPDQPVIYVNSAFSEITGYPPSEILGRNCRFLQGKDRKQPGIARIRTCLEQLKPCMEVLRNYRKDGTLFYNELTLTPILNPAGEVQHYIGVIRDVTDQVTEARRKDRIHRILEEITADADLSQIAQSLCDLLRLPLASATVHMHVLHADNGCLQTLATSGAERVPEDLPGCIPLAESPFADIADAVRHNKEIIRRKRAPSAEVSQGSVWTFPIRSSQHEVLGSCTFLLPKVMTPDKAQRVRIREVLQLARVAIERYQDRKRLEQNREQLQAYTRQLEKRVAERTRELEHTVTQLRDSNQSLELQMQSTREAEREAMASQALFARMARNFPRGVILVVDPEMRIAHLDGEECAAMGLADWKYQDALVDHMPHFNKAQLGRIRSHISDTLKGKHQSFELAHHGAVYAVNTTPLAVQGEIRWAVLVFSNSTEQKRTQQELIKALRFEQELNDLKSRFMSMASHEFRTPLSAILSSAILIEKQNEPGKEQKRERYLRQIKNNVRNLVVILDDFLSLSRLEEGDLTCQAAPFDMVVLLRAVLEELESSLKIGQHFQERCGTGNSQVVLDPKLTRHILLNLLSNAIKYSPENSPIYIDLLWDTESLEIAITDRGMGIPAEEQDQLFNRFFRARNAVNIPGTGLGLHIVKKYTELMGGHIRFESSVGAGSTFRLQLPRTYKALPHEKDTNR